ncbi:MAG: class A beta-lactamase-related serine hydrolase, partial [Chitinophagaceae bacterium]
SLAGVTFRSLLNHTSGLPRLPANIDLSSQTPYDTYTLNDLFSYLTTAKPANAGNYSYSNLAAGLAGVLAAKISGKAYPLLLQQYVFNGFAIGRTKSSVKAQGYFEKEKAPYWNMAALAPAGDLDCTTAELLDYLTYLSNPKEKRAAQRIAKLEKPTKTISEQIAVGLGWHLLQQTNKPTIYWHNGGTYGFSTFTAYCKKTGKAVVVVINQFNQNQWSDGLGIAIMKKMLE